MTNDFKGKSFKYKVTKLRVSLITAITYKASARSSQLLSRTFLCPCKPQPDLPTSAACFLFHSRRDWPQKISSQLCDASIKADYGSPLTTSSIAPFARL
jgi:hypothetical protein